MRLWSISPSYLDDIGLVALWREGLLAQKVLMGNTKGYKHHPQLERFKACKDPVNAIGKYLFWVYKEAEFRCFKFDICKINNYSGASIQIAVTTKQITYEFLHLQDKLFKRNKSKYFENQDRVLIRSNIMFNVVVGEIESWEKVNVSV
jgi:hypothetical protein